MPKKGYFDQTYSSNLDRFDVAGLGVTQPSQIRYIYYFHNLLENHGISPTVKLIEYVKLNGVPGFNSKTSCKPYFEVYSMRDLEKVLILL